MQIIVQCNVKVFQEKKGFKLFAKLVILFIFILLCFSSRNMTYNWFGHKIGIKTTDLLSFLPVSQSHFSLGSENSYCDLTL